MAYFDDILSAVKTVSSERKKFLRDTADAREMAGKLQKKSIARGALDGTLQFPCLVSDSISIDMAATLARTLERVYASFIQSYLSLNNTIDISIDKNPNMFLKKFHHNIKLESTVTDLYNEYCTESDEEYDKMMERVYNGTTKAYINEAENQMIVFNLSDKLSPELFESHKAALEESLGAADFAPFPNVGNSPFYEAIGGDPSGIPTYTATKGIDIAADVAMQNMKDKSALDREKYKLTNGSNIAIPTLLKDSDVKKSNDLQPYLMQVRLMAINDKNEFVQFVDFIVGVKAVLHNIKSEEMIINIQNALQNNGKFFNFIRWTTGEKSFFKDLLFHINDTKLDVANKSKGSSPWWMTLKRLKETASAQKTFFSKHQLVPNSTIVVSSFDVDMIHKQYGFNLNDPSQAKKLMNSLFLMNFIIVNDGTRTIEVLYDGEKSFQTYALETLEREVSLSSNKLGRELTRMVSR